MRHGPAPEVIQCQHPGKYSEVEAEKRRVEQAENDAKIAKIAAAAVAKRKRRTP